MDDQGKRVLRSFPNHPGESWNRFEGRDRRQIYNIGESIQRHLIIKIFQMHRVALTPQVQEGMIDICIVKICDDLIAKSPERPMDAFTRDYLQLIASIAEALYELGFDRRGQDWSHARLWNRMQHAWTISDLLRGHERRAQRTREKIDMLDVREHKRIPGISTSGYYLAAVDTPGGLAGEGMIADNCAADYIDKPASRIYAVRREWNDTHLTIAERAHFLHDLCIFTDKNQKEVRKTAGVAALLRATAAANGETLTLADSVRAAKKFTVPKIKSLLASVEKLMQHDEQLTLDVDMPVASLEVQRRGESSYVLMQALGPRNVPITQAHTHHQIVVEGLAALKRMYRTEEGAQLSMATSGFFAAEPTESRSGICITQRGEIAEHELIAHLRQNEDAEVLVGAYTVTPDSSLSDLQFLQSRGVPLNLTAATPVQKAGLKPR